MIEYGLNLDTYNNYRTQSKFASKRAIGVGGYVARWMVWMAERHPAIHTIHLATYPPKHKKSSIRSYFDAALLYTIPSGRSGKASAFLQDVPEGVTPVTASRQRGKVHPLIDRERFEFSGKQ